MSVSVSEAIFKAKTPGQKAAATKRLNAYVAEQVAEGKEEKWVRAGVAAAVTRLRKAG